jgi:hypothetical protein
LKVAREALIPLAEPVETNETTKTGRTNAMMSGMAALL